MVIYVMPILSLFASVCGMMMIYSMLKAIYDSTQYNRTITLRIWETLWEDDGQVLLVVLFIAGILVGLVLSFEVATVFTGPILAAILYAIIAAGHYPGLYQLYARCAADLKQAKCYALTALAGRQR